MSTRNMKELRMKVGVIQPEAEAGEITEYEIVTDNRDRIAYELLAAKRQWPADTNFLFLTVCAWAALKRSGVTPYPDPAKFLENCTYVEPIDVEDVDPTPPVADTGS